MRLEQGDMARATDFNIDPAAQARAFEACGFEYLHVVDLDGAFAGRAINAPAIEAILQSVDLSFSPVSSPNSHALAIFQSRLTVSCEIPRISAVSSILNPPK